MAVHPNLVAVVLMAALPICFATTYATLPCKPPFQFINIHSASASCEMLETTDVYGSGRWENGNFFAEDRAIDVGCSTDGDYPSETCEMFYRCRDGKASLMSCDSPGYPFFDAVLGRCSHTKRCAVFDCFNKPHMKVGLKDHASPFFAYCFNVNGPPYIFSGPHQKLHLISRCYGQDVFDVASQRCRPRCLQEGLIPDTSDCHRYFLCRLQDSVNNIFNMRSFSCPKGHGFLERELRCAPEDDIPACKDPLPNLM